ncbi:hypothetical protein R3P38DRAFT_3532708 [Favolaschia claudopus]|uniref:Uncharacterized protein n=1 Tax=Favolaschia claudopus TaxID=2862362 RepID=A0AAW0BG59_9AGAR
MDTNTITTGESELLPGQRALVLFRHSDNQSSRPHLPRFRGDSETKVRNGQKDGEWDSPTPTDGSSTVGLVATVGLGYGAWQRINRDNQRIIDFVYVNQARSFSSLSLFHSSVCVAAMFPAAADFSLNEIKAYRTFTFPVALSDPAHEPHFSVEDAPNWITSQGYQLYLEHSSEDLPGESDPDDIPTGILKAYRNIILENPHAWINPLALKVYLDRSADAPIGSWRGCSQSVEFSSAFPAPPLWRQVPLRRGREQAASSHLFPHLVLVHHSHSLPPTCPLPDPVHVSPQWTSSTSTLALILDSEPQHPPQPSSKSEDVPIIIPAGNS